MTGETKAIETEAAVTRDRISGTIDELQARLSPQALVDNAVGSINAAGKKAVTFAQTAAGRHPVAFGAAALAIGIALLARSRSTRAASEPVDSFTVGADNNKSLAAHRADGHSQAGAPPSISMRSTVRRTPRTATLRLQSLSSAQQPGHCSEP